MRKIQTSSIDSSFTCSMNMVVIFCVRTKVADPSTKKYHSGEWEPDKQLTYQEIRRVEVLAARKPNVIYSQGKFAPYTLNKMRSSKFGTKYILYRGSSAASAKIVLGLLGKDLTHS